MNLIFDYKFGLNPNNPLLNCSQSENIIEATINIKTNRALFRYSVFLLPL